MRTAPDISQGAHAGNGRVAAPVPTIASRESGSNALFAAVSLLLGILVAVLGFLALLMWADAHNARNAAESRQARMSEHVAPATSASLGELESFAGAAPSNAEQLAAAHRPYPAALPAAPAGEVAN